MESWLYSLLKHAKYLEQCLTHSKCPQSISSYESTLSRPHPAMPAVCPVSVLVLESSPASPVCTLSHTGSPYYVVPVAVFCPPSCSVSPSGLSQAGCLSLLRLGEEPASLPMAFPLHPPNTGAVSMTPAIFLCIWKDFRWHR